MALGVSLLSQSLGVPLLLAVQSRALSGLDRVGGRGSPTAWKRDPPRCGLGLLVGGDTTPSTRGVVGSLCVALGPRCELPRAQPSPTQSSGARGLGTCWAVLPPTPGTALVGPEVASPLGVQCHGGCVQALAHQPWGPSGATCPLFVRRCLLSFRVTFVQRGAPPIRLGFERQQLIC